MRLLKKIVKILGATLVVLVALVAFLLWWTHPKRPVTGAFVREAGAGTFKFTDIPRGRTLSPEEVDAYARKLLGEMILRQKVLQMSGDSSIWDLIKLVTVEKGKYNDTPIGAGADTRLAIPPIGFSDGPRGVVLNHSTAFTVAMARGASWDRDLQRRFGDVRSDGRSAPRAARCGAGSASTCCATPRWGARSPYRAATAVLAMLVFAVIAGLVLATMLQRGQPAAPGASQATPAEVPPARPVQPRLGGEK